MNATTTGTLVPDLELQPCKSSQRPSPQCTAIRHDTAAAYRRGCRCTPARRAIARYENERRLDALHGQSRTLPNTGAIRRLQALRALGYTGRDLATRIGVDERNIARWPHRTWISRTHHDAVCRVYNQLADTPGPDERARRHAAHQGWLPPLWWDDDTIDDPTHHPTTDVIYKEIREHKDRRRLVLTSSDIDTVVIDRLTSGDTSATPASHSERYAAYALLRQRGATATAACEQLKVSSVARTVYAEQYARDNTLEETA